MTINVALVTSEALILGCDSTASTGDYYIDPFQIGLEKDATGNTVYEPDGRVIVKFRFEQLEHIITDAWGGVTKMFPLCSKYCHVAAVTSGVASLNHRTMSSLAADYRAQQEKQKAAAKSRTVKGIAEEFLAFVRAEYDEHYKSSTMPAALRDGPEFLIGGFGQNDKFPCSYRVRVKENDVKEEFASGDGGLSWNAQSDTVERITRGYDVNLRTSIEKSFDQAIKSYQTEMNQAVLRIVGEVLAKLNAQMPLGVDTALPTNVVVTPPWEKFRLGVPYSVLPMQEAVNFVSYLILMQAGKSRFARGVATVGGRTHIGVITKEKGYVQLNEPELAHHYTGFADDH